MTLGETLKDLRLTASLSCQEAAAKVGVSRVTYWAWETGKTVPSAVRIRALARTYKVSATQLLELLPEEGDASP